MPNTMLRALLRYKTIKERDKAGITDPSERYPYLLYNHTSGRWICDEATQLAQRRISFDVKALRSVCTELLRVPRVVIVKVKENDYSRMFSLGSKLGKEVLAVLPTPNAGADPYQFVASEVATMDFMRNVLGVPVPKVLEWSNRNSGDEQSASRRQAVGSEYIVMERPAGIPLDYVWDTLSEKEQFKVVKNIAKIEGRIVGYGALPAYGSIYYKEDCPVEEGAGVAFDPAQYQMCEDQVSRFVVGPVTERCFLGEFRRGLDVDRGPWKSPEEYYRAIVQRELAWIQAGGNAGKCEDRILLSNQPVVSTEEQIEVLEKFLEVLPYITPNKGVLAQRALWHGDLVTENIYVDKTDWTTITAILDWQAAFSAPLFTHFKFAALADCPGPYEWGIWSPEEPDNSPFSILDSEGKILKKTRKEELRLKKYYEMMSRKYNRSTALLLDVLHKNPARTEHPTTLLFEAINCSHQRGIIAIIFKVLLIDVITMWDGLVAKWNDPPVLCDCPISFSKDEVLRTRRESKAWRKAYGKFTALKSQLALGREGWVDIVNYADAVRLFNTHKAALVELQGQLDRAKKPAEEQPN